MYHACQFVSSPATTRDADFRVPPTEQEHEEGAPGSSVAVTRAPPLHPKARRSFVSR